MVFAFLCDETRKSGIVFDSAATFKGICLNHAVFPGVSFLNRLTDVLTHIRLGRFANHLAKPVLLSIPKCDLDSNIREIDLGSNPMPDSKALGLIWDVEKDSLKVHCSKILTMTARLSRREMLRFLASHFDSLGYIAPYLLGGKLILHRATWAGVGWDDEPPKYIMVDCSAWLCLLQPISEVLIFRYCFWENETETRGDESVSYTAA